MDPAVVIPLLTEKIAASKRKKGAAKLVGGMTLTWWRRREFLQKKVAAQNTQHRIRTIRARREYQKWSKERQVCPVVITPSRSGAGRGRCVP